MSRKPSEGLVARAPQDVGPDPGVALEPSDAHISTGCGWVDERSVDGLLAPFAPARSRLCAFALYAFAFAL